jgi:hypothetical protein
MQVWLSKDYTSPAQLSRVTKVTFSRLRAYSHATAAGADKDVEDGDACEDGEPPAAHDSDYDEDGQAGASEAEAEAAVKLACDRQGEPMLMAAGCCKSAGALRTLLAKQKVRSCHTAFSSPANVIAQDASCDKAYNTFVAPVGEIESSG